MTVSEPAGREVSRVDVPFLDLKSQSSEVAAEVLTTWRGQLDSAAFVGGPEVTAFEEEFADYTGVRHVIGVANGTDALELAYRAAGIGPGDEVIVPVNTFIATAEAVTRVGATPVFVDCDQHLLIDADAIENAITARTRAIVPVHLYGQVADLAAITRLADRRGLTVIEDAAQSQGARSAEGRAGALAKLSATSFYPGKNLGAAGDAGAVMTDDDEMASFVRSYAAHGSTVKYVHDRPGTNSRLDAIQATILRAKLRRLEAWNSARRSAAANYHALLEGIPGVVLPRTRPGNLDVWHLYVVQVPQRDRVLAGLGAAGVGAAIHYPVPLHLTAAYTHLGYARGQFPVAEAAAERILSLPMFPHLTGEQQVRVATALDDVMASGSAT